MALGFRDLGFYVFRVYKRFRIFGLRGFRA